MTILVTGASGQLGRLAIESLLARGAAASDLIAGARTPAKAADLAERGVRVVELDYMKPATIEAALQGVDAVLLVSGSDPGDRFAGHRNVIDAARAAGLEKLVYTSAPQATTTDFILAPDHKATEEALAASGIPTVILRNNWYTENYVQNVLGAAESGKISAAAGDGRVASASRKDFAEAAAVALLEDGHEGNVYELGGDVAWNFDDLAAAASDILGREVVYERLSADELVGALQGAGLDAGTAGFVAAIDEGISRGVLAHTDGTLAKLIGRPATPLVDGLREAVDAARAAV
jgi:NAD(P)H dehydrogenase (quinone)